MFHPRKIIGALAIVVSWLALLLSPVGHYVAGISIVALVILLYVCGCIEIRITPDD